MKLFDFVFAESLSRAAADQRKNGVLGYGNDLCKNELFDENRLGSTPQTLILSFLSSKFKPQKVIAEKIAVQAFQVK